MIGVGGAEGLVGGAWGTHIVADDELDGISQVGDLAEMAWVGDVAIIAVLAFTAIAIVMIVFGARALSGRRRLKQVEAERDEATRRADALQVRVDQLERRLDRRADRQLAAEEFDRELNG